MTENEISRRIVHGVYCVHSGLGPGLLESVYEGALAHELSEQGLNFVRQCPLPVEYKGERWEQGFRCDLLVEDKVIVELKTVETIAPFHIQQLLTYLKVSQKRLGLLINFQTELIKDGIRRYVNKL